MAKIKARAASGRSPQPIVIRGDFTLGQANELRAQLLATFGDRAPVSLDWADVAAVDVSAIQLLLSARRSAQALGVDISLAKAADGPLLAALNQGGFLSEAADPADRRFWLKDQHNQ